MAFQCLACDVTFSHDGMPSLVNIERSKDRNVDGNF